MAEGGWQAGDGDAFAVLGQHRTADGPVVRASAAPVARFPYATVSRDGALLPLEAAPAR